MEYCCSKNKRMEVVSAAYEYEGKQYSLWLYKDYVEQKKFAKFIKRCALKGYTFLSHNFIAECRAFQSCGVDILNSNIQGIDTFLEYRCLTNHNDKLMWGKHLLDGREVRTERPEYGRDKKVSNAKPKHSLSSTIYKLLGIKIDTKHKDEMRDLIISAPDKFSIEERNAIEEYGLSDIKYLPQIFREIMLHYKSLLGDSFNKKELFKEMHLRADYSRRSAIMEEIGYPINYEATKNFSNSVEDILTDIARDINTQFDWKPFTFDPTKDRYKVNQKVIRGWVGKSQWKNKWFLTDKGDYSLSSDAFAYHFKFSHVYPRGNFGAQFVKYLKTKQSLNGFRTSLNGKKSFWDNVGSDGRVRPFLNPYGSQTARTQPAATGFIPLKAAWMRSLIQPPNGRAMCGLDYGSQEFLISALVSEDKKMIEAYKTGDVYLHFAKEIGMVSQHATKHSHPKERQVCKSTVLGISYSMTKVGLAAKLRMDMEDDTISEEYADKLIKKFNKTYRKFYEWKQSITGSRGYVETESGSVWQESRGLYQKQGYLQLKCGWYLWGDNDNLRSVGNFPIQGFGSSIMRKSVSLAQDMGLDIPYTLHDAVYMEYDSFDWGCITRLKTAMIEGFVHYFPEHMKEYARLIRIDGETWSPDYKNIKLDQEPMSPVGALYGIKVEEVHVDSRNVNEYNQFKKYFKKDEDIDDL